MHVVMDMMELLCQMILKRMMEDFFFHLNIMIGVTKDLPTLQKIFQTTTLELRAESRQSKNTNN